MKNRCDNCKNCKELKRLAELAELECESEEKFAHKFDALPATLLTEPFRFYLYRWQVLGFGAPEYLAWINPLPNVLTITSTLDVDQETGWEVVVHVVWADNEYGEGPGAEWYHFSANEDDGPRLAELSMTLIQRIYEGAARENLVYSDGVTLDEIDPCIMDFVRNPDC